MSARVVKRVILRSDERRRVSLSKLGMPIGLAYWATIDEDGVITLTPADKDDLARAGK